MKSTFCLRINYEFFLLNNYLFESQKLGEREKGRKRDGQQENETETCWFTPYIGAMAWASPG